MCAMTAPAQPSSFPPCEDCGGTQVGGLRLTGTHHVGLDPAARVQWLEPLLGLNAVVCLTCTRVRFFADNMYKLHDAAQRHPEWFVW